MQRIKRSYIETTVDCNNNIIIKKPKLDNITKESLFENLPNETIYEIFDYLDINHIYEAFFNLNTRFQNLLLHSNLPIQVNISNMSKTSFQRYHQKFIVPNKHRINYLRVSNPFTVDIIFSPPVILCKFIQLKTLVLDHIHTKYLRNIFMHAITLNKLRSLVLSLVDVVQDQVNLFTWIFRLPKLKSCRITYETKEGRNQHSLFESNDCTVSPIEHLVINTDFFYHSLEYILLRVPNLRHLSINCLIGCTGLTINPSFIEMKQLKSVSLKLEGVSLEQLETLIEHFFRHVEVLRLTTIYDPTYLNAQQWQELIVSHMPKLRIFDFYHDGGVYQNAELYHQMMNAFNTPFWIERGWYFTHQHDWRRHSGSGIFYTTDPYRRKDYTFNCELEEQKCLHRQETNLNIVKNVRIDSKQLPDNPVNYFPNTHQLTIEHYFETPDGSIVTTLNRILPLQQLTKLVFSPYDFPFEQIIHLLRYTPHLHTLELYSIYVQKNSLKFLKQTDTFQHVSKVNQIKHVKIEEMSNLEKISLIVDLFPRMEYFRMGLMRKEIEQIVQHILTKRDNQTPHLFFVRISRVPRVCLREVDRLIIREKLLDDYFIKYVNRDLYLWW